MLKFVRSPLLMAAVLLAGCGQAPDSNDGTPAPAEPAVSYARLDPGSNARPSNSYSRRLFEMNDQVRLATFRKYMVESGERCDLVTEAVLRGGHQGLDMWRIACSDSGEWMISIAPDSSTKFLSCAIVRQLGDDCRAAWKWSRRRK